MSVKTIFQTISNQILQLKKHNHAVSSTYTRVTFEKGRILFPTRAFRLFPAFFSAYIQNIAFQAVRALVFFMGTNQLSIAGDLCGFGGQDLQSFRDRSNICFQVSTENTAKNT